MLRLADRDIAALDVLCRAEEVHLAILCFHAQQAIEKCFKAAPFCHLIEFRRTHDLQRLTDLLSETELGQMVTSVRAWAEAVFQGAKSAEANS